jgi:hypothetical protein
LEHWRSPQTLLQAVRQLLSKPWEPFLCPAAPCMARFSCPPISAWHVPRNPPGRGLGGRPQPWRRVAGGEDRSGFALPLALLVALLLLLSCLATQSLILQVRSRRAIILELRQAEDQLASVAHLLVGRLRERHPCLLGLTLATWSLADPGCADATDIEGLIRGEAHGLSWQLIAWQPQPGGRQVDVLLELHPQAGRPPRRGEFRLELEPTAAAPLVLALRPQGLRGIPAAAL